MVLRFGNIVLQYDDDSVDVEFGRVSGAEIFSKAAVFTLEHHHCSVATRKGDFEETWFVLSEIFVKYLPCTGHLPPPSAAIYRMQIAAMEESFSTSHTAKYFNLKITTQDCMFAAWRNPRKERDKQRMLAFSLEHTNNGTYGKLQKMRVLVSSKCATQITEMFPMSAFHARFQVYC
ncbi:hypothetical protein J1614_004116 [Plenodomus biglobosus]|nr:hypothetical protein J1614_004116 [Plenodomus biglobosus]